MCLFERMPGEPVGRAIRAKKPEDVQLEFFPAAVLGLLGHHDGDVLEFRLRGARPLMRIQVSSTAEGFAWCASVHGAYRASMRLRPVESEVPVASRGQALIAAADFLRGLLPLIPSGDRASVKAWLGSVYAHAHQPV